MHGMAWRGVLYLNANGQLVEDRADQKISVEFGQIVCFLVWLRTRIVEKQLGCDATTATHVLQLFRAVRILMDKGGGGAVDFRDLDHPTIHLVKDRMGTDTETFTTLLFVDLQTVLGHLRQMSALAV
jgi:hypothetical protein